MARVKIDFGKKPVPWQIEKSRSIRGRMSGNLHFPAPDPALLLVKNATDALEVAYMEALDFDRKKKAIMRIRRKELHRLIAALADYVQQASGGDEQKILSSGFGVRQVRMAATVLNAPEWVKVKHSGLEHEIDLRWKAVKHAKAYIIQVFESTLGLENVFNMEVSTKSSIRISGLKSGKKYWFRVLTVNSAGKSGWSDPAAGRTM